MKILHDEAGKRGAFIAFYDDEQAGLISYIRSNGDMHLMHTEVEEKFRGRNVGKNILLEIVKHARENNMKIHPVCPFAISMFKRMEEIHDVLLNQESGIRK
jgi:predicted GNAT family acetyltransferase